ncbi:MAG: TRAP transporter large permease subunit [Myxococcota bacterium]
MTVLPLSDVILRPLGSNIPGGFRWVSVLAMIVGFTGGMLAARDAKHLALSTVRASAGDGWWRRWADALVGLVTLCTTWVLAFGAYQTVVAESAFTGKLSGGVPDWLPLSIIPIAYLVMSVRLWMSQVRPVLDRFLVLALAGAVIGLLQGLGPEAASSSWVVVLVALVLATVLGAPIFVALGGAAVALFWFGSEPVAAVAAETVRLTKSDTIPTIPLFTFTGTVLAESRASERLVRAFRALFGWLPGGMAVMTAIVCAFFTTFTGASGVTILALGGLLYPVLRAEKYRDDFGVGLLTASGSIGLLFPPSLPIILYGVVAKVPIDKMFVAGIVPGLVLVASIAVFGIREGSRPEIPRHPFSWREAVRASWAAKWELALPLIVVGGIFSGFATLVEAAAITTAYALLVEMVVHRDLRLADLPRVGRECATLIGGVLVILGVALGLTNFLVDAEIPMRALDWVKSGVESKFLFLLLLNLFLLVVGCLMDIFSAIAVVAPLILPIGEYFEIDPIHLGVIFLANLELGFLTPPVGMNLFLASFRFEKPLTQVYRTAIPFLVIMTGAVLVITYVPWLTMAPVEWVFGPEPEPIEFEF